MEKIELRFVARNDPRYVAFRDRHYVPNRGSQGQQAHFLCLLDGRQVGIMSGGSAVYSVACRDKFFGIPQDRTTRESLWLPAIVNNTVFRLEEHQPNLGTRFLRLWRRAVPEVWAMLYGVHVIGFETFVVETATRVGTVYLADNWHNVGTTKGRTKAHTTPGGMADSRSHRDTEPKIVLTRWRRREARPTTPYVSCWRRSTPEEKKASKLIADTRRQLLETSWYA